MVQIKKTKMKRSKINISKERYHDVLTDFISVINNILDEDDVFEQHMNEHFNDKETKELEYNYPVLLKHQTSYGINHIINNNKIFILDDVCHYNYDKTTEIQPTYETIHVKRNQLENIMTYGYLYIHYKKKPFVVQIAFNYDNKAPIFIHYLEEDEKLAHEMLNVFHRVAKETNFLKGEKICINTKGVPEFLDYKKLDWDDIILEKSVKDKIIKNVIYPIANKSNYDKYDLPWKRGVLLSGSPGVGKTLQGKVLCNVLDTTLIWITAQNYDGGSFEIDSIYEMARNLAPSVVFIEDIDLIGKERDFGNNTSILGELLTQLDGITDNSGVFTIATTNKPAMLDEALANRPARFDVTIKIKPPNEEGRRILIDKMLKPVDKITIEEMDNTIRKTDGFTGAHIKELIINARKTSFLSQQDGIITDDILKQSLKELEESFEKYKEEQQEYCG